MQPIQIIGIEELNDEDKTTINKLANEYYEKIKRSFRDEVSIKLHIKEHSKTGKRHKSDIKIQLMAPTKIIEAQESDWDLARTLHKVFKNIERELQHKLRVDDQREKPYS